MLHPPATLTTQKEPPTEMFIYNNEKFCASVVCLLMSMLTYNTWTMMINEIPYHTLEDHINLCLFTLLFLKRLGLCLIIIREIIHMQSWKLLLALHLYCTCVNNGIFHKFFRLKVTIVSIYTEM